MMIIGGAQAVNIAVSILRMKVLAVWLGPAGVGLLGIYNNLQQMATNAAGVGMQSSGVRQLASARGDESTLGRVRRVLLLALLVQGVVAMVAVWLLREPIAVWLLDDASRATEVGLVGLAVLLGLLAAARTTLLQGLRRISELGKVTVLGAAGGTIVGLGAVWLHGMSGLVWFVIAQPLVTLLVALFYTRSLSRDSSRGMGLRDIWTEWKPMASLGSVFMLGGLVTTATLLTVRGWLTQDLGLDAAGQFAAAWGISMTYVGFLLGAMGADYYPRLTEVIHDQEAASRLMNDQLQLGLAIGGPVLLLLIGLAPLVIWLLYSDEFTRAVTLLQWQSVGNVFKLASWALSFSIVAAARGKTFFFLELSFNMVFLIGVWLLLPNLGLLAAGVVFLLGYIVYFSTANILARRLHGFRWQGLSLKLLGLHAVLAVAMLGLAFTDPLTGGVAALALGIGTGFVGGHIVLTKIGPHGRAAPLARFYSAVGWPVRSSG